jgi:hypothetical protein
VRDPRAPPYACGADHSRPRALDRWIRDKYELRQYARRCVLRALRYCCLCADVTACRNCAPPDGKAQPTAPAAAAVPPVPPPKPAAFAQPSAVAFKLPTAAAAPPAPAPAAPPAFDLLGGLDAPAPSASASWNAFAEPPKDDWMADFVVAAPAAVEWDAFASAPVIPAPPQHTTILDLFSAQPAPGGAFHAVPVDLAAQLAGMQVRAPAGGAAAAPPALPAKPASDKNLSPQGLL